MKDSKKLVGFWSKRHEEMLRGPQYSYNIDAYYLDKYLSHIKNKKILDVGCGNADIKVYFDNLGCEYWGVDIVPETVSRLKSLNINAIMADARDLPFEDNTFDFVFSFGVVEHFEGTEKAVEEHVRVAKPGGDILILVPNRLTPYTLIETTWHILNGTKKYGISADGKRYIINEMKQMVKEFNVKVQHSFYYYISALFQGANIKGFEKFLLNFEIFLDNFPRLKMFFSQMVWLHLVKR